MKDVTCSVCNKLVDTAYCGDCGQKIGRKKTTVLSMILDLFSKFFSFENSVPATILKIIIEPKTVVNNYMDGNRRYYSMPGSLLFWALTIGAIHVYFIDSEILGGTFDFTLGNSESKVSAQSGALAITGILLVVTSLITYVRSKNGLTIQLISIIYIMCAFFIVLTIAFDLFNALIPLGEGSGLGILILVFSSVWWHARVMTKSGKKLMLFLNFILQTTFIIGLVYLLVISTYSLNGE